MAVASLLVLLTLGILHTMATFVSKNPLSSLGCKLCITYGEWLSALPCVPPASWEPIIPSLSPRGEQSGWCSEEGPPRSLVLPAAPAGCSVSECASLSPWKPLLHRTHTTVVITKECGFAHPQVLPMALSPCGSSLMPCFLASWSSPVAPWCFCTDTARGCSMFTPVLGTTDAPQRPEPPTPSWCWWSPLSSFTYWIPFFLFISLPSQIFIYVWYRPLIFWFHVSPLLAPFCLSLGILDFLDSALMLSEVMAEVQMCRR